MLKDGRERDLVLHQRGLFGLVAAWARICFYSQGQNNRSRLRNLSVLGATDLCVLQRRQRFFENCWLIFEFVQLLLSRAVGLRNIQSWGLRFFREATFIQSLGVRRYGCKKLNLM